MPEIEKEAMYMLESDYSRIEMLLSFFLYLFYVLLESDYSRIEIRAK